ncbi:MAG: phosphopyruvate hydratase [Bdellovibrionia bacterium]
MAKIKKIQASEVLDSRGFPTVEACLTVEDARHPGELLQARALVPSGASTGEGEALELRDADPKRFMGKGVLKAVSHIESQIAPALEGKSVENQKEWDDLLIELDGTPNKSRLGANAILAVSMAFVRARALTQNRPTFQVLAQDYGSSGITLPVPLMNILNGGKHADNGLAVQEFMIVPAGFSRFSDALRAGVEIFHCLKKILHHKGRSTAVGDEGGFAPVFPGEKPHEQALDSIMQAIEASGYQPGKQIYLALDAAASEFYQKNASYAFEGKNVSSNEMASIYSDWSTRYPILSIEDGLAEHDWAGWKHLTDQLGKKCQLVGDDLFVTNPIFLKQGIEKQVANAILIKLNQIGSVSETLQTMQMAKQAGYHSIVSHRSGETEDTFIADLAVATDCAQIKTGSASRTDRIAKYNQLLRLEKELGERAQFLGLKTFQRLIS